MLVGGIIFLAIFIQSVSGFGLALVSMPLLVSVVGIHVATPLVAVVGATAELFMLIYYREAFNLRAVSRLSAASLLAIPIGIMFLRTADSELITAVLGLIILGYALYALFGFALPSLTHHSWAYGFGFIAGLLSGAYNTSGPLVVVYGNCRRWSPSEFKSNLQGFFLLNSIMTIAAHTISHHFTALVWHHYATALPGIGLGLVMGFWLDRRLDPIRFCQIVLMLLVILGVRLIF